MRRLPSFAQGHSLTDESGIMHDTLSNPVHAKVPIVPAQCAPRGQKGIVDGVNQRDGANEGVRFALSDWSRSQLALVITFANRNAPRAQDVISRDGVKMEVWQQK